MTNKIQITKISMKPRNIFHPQLFDKNKTISVNYLLSK